MGTVAQKLQYLNGTKSAIKNAIQNRGVSVADSDTFRDYATKIGNIGETVDKSKYGATIDLLLGGVDSEGTYIVPTTRFELDLTGIKKVPRGGLFGKFMRLANITKVEASSIESIEDYGCYQTFKGCRNLTSANLSGLKTVTLEATFQMFFECTGLVDVNLSSLTSCGNNALAGTFYQCTALKTISFPALTNVTSTSFGTSYYAFYGCTALEEIHFRVDMQSTIEAISGYSTKFGATNATIYFDL